MLAKILGPKASGSKHAENDDSVESTLDRKVKTKGMLERKISFIESKILDEKKRALEYKKNGNERAALQSMRRKAMFEKQSEQHASTLLRLNENIVQLEASGANTEVFQTMKTASDATHARLRNARIQEFDQVLDYLQESSDEISEVNQALGRTVGSIQQGDDDDDLLAELDEMEARDFDDELLKVASPTGHREHEMGDDDYDIEQEVVSRKHSGSRKESPS